MRVARVLLGRSVLSAAPSAWIRLLPEQADGVPEGDGGPTAAPHPWVLCSPLVRLAVPAGSGCGRAAGMEPVPLTEPSLRAAHVLGLGWELRANWVLWLEKV